MDIKDYLKSRFETADQAEAERQARKAARTELKEAALQKLRNQIRYLFSQIVNDPQKGPLVSFPVGTLVCLNPAEEKETEIFGMLNLAVAFHAIELVPEVKPGSHYSFFRVIHENEWNRQLSLLNQRLFPLIESWASFEPGPDPDTDEEE